MPDNYPPGVTGREYAIAGPETEVEGWRECDWCGFEGDVLVRTYAGSEEWTCPRCEKQHEGDEEWVDRD